MSQWSDRLENHQIQQLLTTTQTLIDQAGEHAEADAQALESLERIRAVSSLLIRTLENTDPQFVPIQPLTNMVPHVNKMNSELQNYVSNQNPARLQNANNHADNFLPQLAGIPILATPEDVEGLRESITSFRRSAGQFIHHLEQDAETHREAMAKDREASGEQLEEAKERIADVEAELGKLEEAIQAQKARLDTAISEFQGQFSKQQDARQEQFAESEKERADANKETVDELNEQLTELTEAHKEKFTGICDDAKDKLTNYQTATQDLVDGLIQKLEEHKAQAEKLVHVIGNTGMVGGYQKTANTARNTARVWQVVAIGSFVGLILFAVKVFSATQSPDFSWAVFSGRAFVAGTFGIAAAYAARQSDRHEETERYNRRVELELASIEPYLVGLPETLQHQVKEELANRLFGQKPAPKKETKVSGTNADLLRMTLETLSDLTKKFPG